MLVSHGKLGHNQDYNVHRLEQSQQRLTVDVTFTQLHEVTVVTGLIRSSPLQGEHTSEQCRLVAAPQAIRAQQEPHLQLRVQVDAGRSEDALDHGLQIRAVQGWAHRAPPHPPVVAAGNCEAVAEQEL